MKQPNFHKMFLTVSAVMLVMLFALTVVASDDPANGDQETSARIHRSYEDPKSASVCNPAPHLLPKRQGRYTKEDWAPIIDAVWGDGLRTETKLLIFDGYWEQVNIHFGCFQNIEPNWAALRDLYRPEIEAGVSRGRFAGIMETLNRFLRETHTYCSDLGVWNTVREPGVPLMYIGDWYKSGFFGASLTPLPDKTALVYRVVENHPLGLEPGDIVLGYDGVSWEELYPELVAAELPNSGYSRGLASNDSSVEHMFLMSVGQNWHLFETIDILKYDSGEVEHFATSLLAGQTTPLASSEQMPIPGIAMPDVDPNSGVGTRLTWGTIERPGVTCGYICVWAWFTGSEHEFYNAIDELQDTDGLIIDLRLNSWGSTNNMETGFAVLFDESVSVLNNAVRCGDPDDHETMCPIGSGWEIYGDSEESYNKPIAVLVGPGAFGAGDRGIIGLSKHPRARLFGKASAMAPFNNNGVLENLHSDFLCRIIWKNTYHAQPFPPDEYLAHADLTIDEPVWLTPDDVAQGIDTVVESAVTWIYYETNVDDNQLPARAQLLNCVPNPFNPQTTISFELAEPMPATLRIFDLAGGLVDVLVEGETMTTGTHTVTWNGRDLQGRTMPSGTYFYRLEAGVYTETKRMMLIR